MNMSIYPDYPFSELIHEQVRSHRWTSVTIDAYCDPIPDTIEYVEETQHQIATITARNGVIVAHLTTAGSDYRIVSLTLDVPAHPLSPGCSDIVPARTRNLRQVSHLRQSLDQALSALGSVERGTPSSPFIG